LFIAVSCTTERASSRVPVGHGGFRATGPARCLLTYSLALWSRVTEDVVIEDMDEISAE
jgi:hypothetical protein